MVSKAKSVACFAVLVFIAAAPQVQEKQVGNYKLKGPFTSENLTLFLIAESDAAAQPNHYMPLNEALDGGAFTVYETGDVDQLSVENRSDRPVFIQAGDIVKGGNQDRVLATDLIVPPNSGKIAIASFCVEHGRWSQRQEESHKEFGSANQRIASKGMRKAMRGKSKSQQEVWANVANDQQKLSNNLQGNVAAQESASSYQLSLENEALQQRVVLHRDSLSGLLELAPNTIGVAFIINGSFSNADVYGSPALFRQLWPRLLEAAITEAISERDAPQTAGNDSWMNELLRLTLAPSARRQEDTERMAYEQLESDNLMGFRTLDKASRRVVHYSWDAKH